MVCVKGEFALRFAMRVMVSGRTIFMIWVFGRMDCLAAEDGERHFFQYLSGAVKSEALRARTDITLNLSKVSSRDMHPVRESLLYYYIHQTSYFEDPPFFISLNLLSVFLSSPPPSSASSTRLQASL